MLREEVCSRNQQRIHSDFERQDWGTMENSSRSTEQMDREKTASMAGNEGQTRVSGEAVERRLGKKPKLW